MDYDINTPEGMAAAIAWTTQLVGTVREGGTWAVPRSGLLLKVERSRKRVTVLAQAAPDPAIKRVFEAMGWTYIGAGWTEVEI